MAGFLRMMFCLAAMTGIAAMPLAEAPAMAAESTVTASEAASAVSAKTAPAVRRVAPRRAGAIRGNLNCSGVWCGRQFVLMLGVGY